MKSSNKENPRVLYCDNHILVLDKAAGMTVQDELIDWGKNYLKLAFSKPGNVFLHPIHRIDRVVSGIVVCARTSKALSRLQASIRNNLVSKKYSGIVKGVLKSEGILEHFLIHDHFRADIVPNDFPGAKLCRLEYKIARVIQNYTELMITLHTGRYHQIRAQFGAINHPIVGDRKYGSRFQPSNLFGIALHHAWMKLPHPITGEFMEFETDRFTNMNWLNITI